MKYSTRGLRQLQKQRHMNDINRMILANPLFKNLNARDQKKLANLIYKSEMIEVFVRDKELVRINESFESIIAAVADMLDDRDQDGWDGEDYDEER